MSSVADFLKRAADRNGFNRDRFEERKIPNDFSDLCILPFFGDLRSLFLLSSFLLNPYKSNFKSSKYFILASWPGFQSLFPYVNEYWSLGDFSQIKNFYDTSQNFSNKSNLNVIYTRNINEFFRDVIDSKLFSEYYQNGFTNKYFSRFKSVERFLPFVASTSVLGKDFMRDISTKPGYKIFIHPTTFYNRWYQGFSKKNELKFEFWSNLTSYLLENNCTPVVWQSYFAHDLSAEFGDRCIFLRENDMVKVLSAIRATGLCLNVFESLSYFSLLARCPYVTLEERPRYFLQKDYEIEDLFPNIKKEYIFSFSTILNGDHRGWKNNIFKIISSKIDKFLPEIDKNDFPATGESFDLVDYNKVKEIKSLKFGTKLLKVSYD